MKSILEKKQLFDIIQETNDDVIQKTKIDQYLDTNYTDNLLESEMLARKMVAIDDIVVRKHVIENGMAKKDVDDGQVVKKQNKANAKSKLEGKIKSLDLYYIKGDGRCGDSGEVGEESFLVFGLSKKQAINLGKESQQNAIVVCGANATPSLLLLK